MRLLPFILLLFIACPALAAPRLSVQVAEKKEIIALSLPGAAGSKVFTLERPSRLVIDVPAFSMEPGLSLPKDYQGSLITGVRAARFNAKTTRIVFDLAGPPGGIESRTEAGRNGVTLRIALTPGRAAKGSREVKTKKEEKPLIVIDAGHGGQDPGTIGPGNTEEKNITLDYARSLRHALLATGRYRVHLTRDEDIFILLRERMQMARDRKAEMFISLHADSDPSNQARGLSVYTLSEKASDAEAEALAARENKVDAVYGLNLSDQSKDVADILVSLAQRDTNNRSATLAGMVVDAMRLDDVGVLENPHRFAGFAVLKSPDTPSILVETGFLSNPKEEKQLLSKAHREKVTRALLRGIGAYFQARSKE